MALPLLFSILSLFLHPSLAAHPTIFPITKDLPTGQYLTETNHGSSSYYLSPSKSKLVVDLGSPVVWLNCGAVALHSLSSLPCRSIQCASAHSLPCTTTTSKCSLHIHNPITGAFTTGELHDHLDFLVACSPPSLLQGLPVGSQGVFGLGNSRTGAPSQILQTLNHPKETKSNSKFSLCLSPNKGMISFGESYSKSLIFTPFSNTNDGYHVKLQGIKIENKKLALRKTSNAMKISTVVPYTKMETEIYRTFVEAFSMAAEVVNMTRAPSHGDFEACYYYVGVGSIKVPVIDFVLQSEMVKWRINERNSMVKVGNEGNVMCLGVLDGGYDLGVSVVLGGYQLEDNLLEFDLESHMVGFSGSLIGKGTSCDQLSRDASALNSRHQSS